MTQRSFTALHCPRARRAQTEAVMKRYEALAFSFAAQIRAGEIPTGSRLPSLRQITSQHGASQSTGARAYYLLEQWGLIKARDRSGFYVAPAVSSTEILPSPQTVPESSNADPFSLVFAVLESVQQPGTVPLGSAFPSPQLFPLPRLAKSLCYAARTQSPWSTVSDLPSGNAHLRQQIALRYVAMGMPQATEEILITSGALEALNLCLSAVTRPGDFVAVESPSFYGCIHAVERMGLKAIEIPVDCREGIDLIALEAALNIYDIRACWAMTNFQNPTGVTLTVQKKKALVELLTRYQVPLIEDDVYGELHFGHHYPLPAKAFDTQGLVMHCSSFSKTLAPGYRIGWVSAGRFAEKIKRLKLMTTSSSAVPAQAGIADYLSHGGYDKHLRKLRVALERQLRQMESALTRWFPEGSSWIRVEGGYFLWIELPVGVDAFELHTRAIANGISVAPGAMFSSTRSFRTNVRLNFGHPWTVNLEEAMPALGRILGGPT